MSTSLHIFSSESQDGHPSESRFTQAALSNKADAKSMSSLKFLAPNFVSSPLNAGTSPPITLSLPKQESSPRLGSIGVSNESPDLLDESRRKKRGREARPGTGEVRNGTRGVTLTARRTILFGASTLLYDYSLHCFFSWQCLPSAPQ